MKPGEHFAACRDKNGVPTEGCAGCVPADAADRMMVCTRCFRRIRRLLEDAPELVTHLRSKADPQKSTWNFDRLRSSAGRVDMPAPIAADLIDAPADIMRLLHDWAAAVDPALAGRRTQITSTPAEQLFDAADWYSQVLLAYLGVLANQRQIKDLGDALLVQHRGEPEWWSLADVDARFGLDDRPRWADSPCPECDTKTVRVIPPRGRSPRRYVCTTCEWEADDRDDDGLWRDAFAEDGVVATSPHDPDWITLTEAATRVRRTVGTVRGWVASGVLHGHLGRYHVDHVDKVAAVKRGEAA